MWRKVLIAAATSALALGGMLPAAVQAHPYDRGYDGRHWDGGGRGYGDDRRGYRGRGHYEGRRYDRRCRDNGTAGTIIGAIAGGLLGNSIANGRYNDRDGTGGAIVGAGVGALAGRAIDRDC
jgi:hypothetical protein